jgi:inositol transport system substrate-binding protein
MAANLPENAEILILEGQNGLYHSAERKAGLLEVLEAERPDVSVLASLDGKYARDEGMTITQNWIQAYPSFDAIIAANDQMALGAIQALQIADRLEGVLIAGVDGVPDALQAIEAGEMSLSIFQNGGAQAGNCADVLKTLMEGGDLPDDIIIPFEPIDATNVADYK